MVGEEVEEAIVVDVVGDRVFVGLDIYGIFVCVIDDVGVCVNWSGDVFGYIGVCGVFIYW